MNISLQNLGKDVVFQKQKLSFFFVCFLMLDIFLPGLSISILQVAAARCGRGAALSSDAAALGRRKCVRLRMVATEVL